jgi:mannose-6-phosphate isomerase-like protein (cupin superfamily)
MTVRIADEIPGLKVEPLRSYVDARGSLWKVHPEAVTGEVYAVSIAPGASRGHHVHSRCGEWFAGLFGGVILVLQYGSKRQELSLEGQRVYVPAGVAHALFGVGPDLALVLAMAERGDSAQDVESVRLSPPEGFPP